MDEYKYKIEKYAYLVTALGIVMGFALLFLFVSNALAEEIDIVGADAGTPTSNFNRGWFLQEIESDITTGNANKLDINTQTCSTGCTIDIAVFAGNYNGTCEWWNTSCGTQMNYVNGVTVSTGTTTITFDGFLSFTTGNNYFFTIKDSKSSTSSADNISVRYKTGSDIITGKLYGSNGANDDDFDSLNEDMYFRFYRDTEYNPTTQYDDVQILEVWDEWGYGSTTVQIGTDILGVRKDNYCQFNETCEIPFEYSFSNIGDYLCIVKYDDLYTSVYESCTEMTDQYLLKDVLIPDNVTSTGTIQYCAVKNTVAGELNTVDCRIEIFWGALTQGQTLAQQLGLEPYDLSTACDEVATSSGGWADDMRYGFQCGLNKVLYWGLKPRDNTLARFDESKENLMDEFPLNVFDLMFKSIKESFSFSSSSPTVFENDNGLHLYVGELNNNGSTSIEVLSVQKIYDVWGETWFDIYLGLTYFIYFVGFLYFARYIMK